MPRDIPRAAGNNLRQKMVAKLRDAGFHHVTLDLLGYRSGSMNEGLK
jgi:uncharacterized protein